jgi:transporter family-2 protein
MVEDSSESQPLLPSSNGNQEQSLVSSILRNKSALLTWSLVAGLSIPLATANNAILNTRSTHLYGQAFYTGLLGVAIGALCLLPAMLQTSEPWGKPSKWWAPLGGICGLPGFGMLIAIPTLGIQTVLLIMLCVQLMITMLLDHFEGVINFSSVNRWLGVILVILGAYLDHIRERKAEESSFSSLMEDEYLLHEQPRSILAAAASPSASMYFSIFVSAAAGACYALQAKCNVQLGKDLGSPIRATVFSAAVNMTASLPIMFTLCYFYNTWPVFRSADWLRFVFAGLQSCFYVLSLTVVPGILGYTPFFLTVQVGSLLISAILDSAGIIGKSFPFTYMQAVAIPLVLLGLLVFNSARSEIPQTESNEERPETEHARNPDGTLVTSKKISRDDL